MLKFKPPKKNESTYLESGLVCNGHWLLDCAWLESLTSGDSLSARKMLKKISAQKVIDTIEGNESRRENLESLLLHHTGGAEKVIPLRDPSCTISARYVFPVREKKGPSAAYVTIKHGEFSTTLDAKYFPILFFDPSATISALDSKSAVVVRSFGRIVALVMPLNPKFTEEY